MPTEIIMPKVDMVMETGTFVEWLKKEGDQVKQGDPIFVIMTDKSAIEVDSPASGVLAGLSAKKDDVIPVSQVIGYILVHGEQLTIQEAKPVVPPSPQPSVTTEGSHEATPLPSSVQADAMGRSGVRATPLARSLAKQMGIDLGKVHGRGVRGRIYKADILDYSAKTTASTPASMPAPPLSVELPLPDARIHQRISLKGPRSIIAKRMAYSSATIPHIYESVTVNMSEVIRLRERLSPVFQEKIGHKPSFTAILVRALAKTLPSFPSLNSSLVGEEILQWEDIHVGIATDIEDYLIVPVLREVQNKNLETIVIEMVRLLEAARSKRLEPRDMSGSTFTISNLGMFGIENFTAIINPPESAILAVGALEEKPRQIDGKVTFVPAMGLTLGVDHRVTDGAAAARFLVQLKETLENPYLLI